MKTFTTKSNARRALKAIGEIALAKSDELLVEVDGKWGFDEEAAKNTEIAALRAETVLPTEEAPVVEEAPKKPAAPMGAAIEGDVHDYSCPHCGIDLQNGVGSHGDTVNDKVVKHNSFEYECLGCGGEFGPQIASFKKEPAGRTINNHSTAERPTKLVWHIADEMFAANPDTRRKDVIAECERRGVAFYTARTQYQQWLQAKKEEAANNAKREEAANAKQDGAE